MLPRPQISNMPFKSHVIVLLSTLSYCEHLTPVSAAVREVAQRVLLVPLDEILQHHMFSTDQKIRIAQQFAESHFRYTSGLLREGHYRKKEFSSYTTSSS